MLSEKPEYNKDSLISTLFMIHRSKPFLTHHNGSYRVNKNRLKRTKNTSYEPSKDKSCQQTLEACQYNDGA